MHLELEIIQKETGKNPVDCILPHIVVYNTDPSNAGYKLFSLFHADTDRLRGAVEHICHLVSMQCSAWENLLLGIHVGVTLTTLFLNIIANQVNP